jgi:hypothetical protein
MLGGIVSCNMDSFSNHPFLATPSVVDLKPSVADLIPLVADFAGSSEHGQAPKVKRLSIVPCKEHQGYQKLCKKNFHMCLSLFFHDYKISF